MGRKGTRNVNSSNVNGLHVVAGDEPDYGSAEIAMRHSADFYAAGEAFIVYLRGLGLPETALEQACPEIMKVCNAAYKDGFALGVEITAKVIRDE